MGGFWVGMAKGMQERKEEQALQAQQQAKEQKALLLKLIEQARGSAVPEAYSTLDQFTQQVIGVDTLKPNAIKQLEKLAQQIPTTFTSTRKFSAGKMGRPEIPFELPKAPLITAEGESVQPPGTNQFALPEIPTQWPGYEEVPGYQRSIYPTRTEAGRDQLVTQIENFPWLLKMQEQQAQIETAQKMAIERLKARLKAPSMPPDAEMFQLMQAAGQLPTGVHTLADYVKWKANLKEGGSDLTFQETYRNLLARQYLAEQGLGPALTPEEQALLDASKEVRTDVQRFNFNLRNPEGSEEQVRRLVDMGATGRFAEAIRLVGSNIVLREQFLQGLTAAGVNPFTLTASTRTMGETAKAILPKFDSVIAQLSTPEYAEKLGVLASRWNEFRAGTYGAGDPLFAELRSHISLLTTGTMRAHVGARGSAMMLDYFKNLADVGKMDAATLKASLQAIRDFMAGYRDMVFPRRLFMHPPDQDPSGLVAPDFPAPMNFGDISDAELQALREEFGIPTE